MLSVFSGPLRNILQIAAHIVEGLEFQIVVSGALAGGQGGEIYLNSNRSLEINVRKTNLAAVKIEDIKWKNLVSTQVETLL